MTVSAFAARKAARQPIGDVASQNEVQMSLANETYNDLLERPKTSRKRRKQANEVHDTSLPLAQLRDSSVNVHCGSLEDGVKHNGSVSDSNGSCDDEPEDRVQTKSPVRRLSTFDPSKSKVLSETETEWTIRLHPNDILAVLGQYDVWVRSGAVSILGAVIHASSRLHRVYSPSTHSIPSIRPVPNPFGTGNAPVELTISSSRSGIRMLRQIAPKFGHIWNGRQQHKSLLGSSKRSFMDIQSTADDPYHRSLRLLEIPSDWQQMVSRLQSVKTERPLAIMVCGPKGAGKSTFCRILANALLQKAPVAGNKDVPDSEGIAFLDLDPGQPEYSPPGDLSLVRMQSYNLGPPFTHPTPGANRLIKAHHFGYISPKEDPEHYYRCALDLLNHQRLIEKDVRLFPLIINSAGWVQGQGLELLSRLIDSMELTDVIYMSTSGPEEVIDTLTQATSRVKNATLHQLSSQSSDIMTRSAADFRMMQTLSYFHMDEGEGKYLDMRWNPWPLTRVTPLVMHYAGPKQAILAIKSLEISPDIQFAEEYFQCILDGCVVGVVAVDQGKETTAQEPHIIRTFEQDEIMSDQETEISTQASILRTATGIPYLPSSNHTSSNLSPDRSFSLGQALIRGIDSDNKTIHLLTPIPSSALQAHAPNIILVRGSLDTPTWAYREEAELEDGRRRVRDRKANACEGFDEGGRRPWAEKQPWAGVVDGHRKSSGKVRRVRRDIRYRPVGEAI